MIERNHYETLDDIANSLTEVYRNDSCGKKSRTCIAKESAWREIKRAKYEGKSPTFETFTAWVDKLFPQIEIATEQQIAIEKQFFIDLLGAAKIFDRTYRELIKILPENIVFEQFQRYPHWFNYHLEALRRNVPL